MKTRQFFVPEGPIIEFAEILEGNSLPGIIVGADGEKEGLAISVDFEEEDSAAILEMIEYVGTFEQEGDD
jgi:hypothetical protein